MSIARFWLLNESERRLLSRKLQDAIRRWHDEWFRDGIASSVTLAGAADIPRRDYRWVSGTAERGLTVAVGVSADADWGLGFAFTGLSEVDARSLAGDIARELELEALRALVRALLIESARVDAGGPFTWGDPDDGEGFDSNRGFVAAQYQIAGGHAALSVVLYPETTAAYLAALEKPAKPARAVVPARRAIESQPVSIEVVVGEAELLLREVGTLAVGDVVRLDRNIAEPLQLVVTGGETLGAGYLGTAGDRKAVQLLSAHH